MSVAQVAFEQSNNYEDALKRAAAECCIDLSYRDVFNKEHHVSSETVRGILLALGWKVDSHELIDAERRQRFEKRLQRVLPRTVVLASTDKNVMLTLPADCQRSVRYDITLEDGHRLGGSVETQQLPLLRETRLDDRHWSSFQLALPVELPQGYHKLSLTINGRSAGDTNVAICPDRAYLPDRLEHGGKTAGFNVALYGLRSYRNWGCGDFADLRALIDWAHEEVGFSFIGLNPLHALHNRVPYNTSPYLPLSVFYKNLIYIDIEGVPEFGASAWAKALFSSACVQQHITNARHAEFVAYHDVDTLKRRFLKVLYREFRRSSTSGSERRRAFQAFCEREGDLLSKFALYCALDEVLHKKDRNRWTWLDWPAEYHDPESSACRAFAVEHPRTVEFYQFIQFVIDEQLAATQTYAKRAGMSIGLYHDLAVATDSCGSDLWAHRRFYVNGCRVGAPPDEFSPKGQDWSFPPPDAAAHSEDGYRLFRESVRKIVSHGGALRLDHVMRLFRLFWIPQGLEAAQGAYVRDRATDLMRILALESVRSQTIIIGEDLGTVTDEIREMLGRFGILSYRLFYFEKNSQDGSFIPSYRYPRQALVSSSTHDLATMAGFWQYRDIEARHDAGLIDEEGYQQQRSVRRREKQSLLDALHREHLVPENSERNAERIPELNGDLHNGVVGFLAQVPSVILLLNQEDLTKEVKQQNLPGSTAEYPNWQHKMLVRVEELSGEKVEPYAEMFRHQLMRSGRRE